MLLSLFEKFELCGESLGLVPCRSSAMRLEDGRMLLLHAVGSYLVAVLLEPDREYRKISHWILDHAKELD